MLKRQALHHSLAALAVLGFALPAFAGVNIISYDFEDNDTQIDLTVGGFASTVQVADGVGVGGSKALQITEGFGSMELFWDLGVTLTEADGAGVFHLSYDHRMDGGGGEIPYFLPNYGDSSTAGTADYRQLTAIGHRPRGASDLQYEARFGVNLTKENISEQFPIAGAAFNRVDLYVTLFEPSNPDNSGFGRVLSNGLQTNRGVANLSTINSPGGSYTDKQVSSLQWFTSGFGFGLTNYLDNLTVSTVDVSDIDAVLADVNGSPTDLLSDFDGDGAVSLADRDAFVEGVLVSFVGDFNLDRKVDLLDLSILGGNWQQAVGSYADGDANGDGVVDLLDLSDLGQNWQSGAGATTLSFADAVASVGLPPVPVPEPGAAALFVIVAGAGLIRRRRVIRSS